MIVGPKIQRIFLQKFFTFFLSVFTMWEKNKTNNLPPPKKSKTKTQNSNMKCKNNSNNNKSSRIPAY